MAETSIAATDVMEDATASEAKEERPTKLLGLFPQQGEWTERDYFDLPESNWFVELSDGRLVMPDMPSDAHQYVVGELFALFRSYVRDRQCGQVRMAPLPARLWPGKVREPDLMFMHHDHADRIEERRWGVPDLVVEVISPRTDDSRGTEDVDRGAKLWEYAQAGVSEYWIVHPVDRTIEVYVSEGEEYRLFAKSSAGGVARSELLEGFEVAVDAIQDAGI